MSRTSISVGVLCEKFEVFYVTLIRVGADHRWLEDTTVSGIVAECTCTRQTDSGELVAELEDLCTVVNKFAISAADCADCCRRAG